MFKNLGRVVLLVVVNACAGNAAVESPAALAMGTNGREIRRTGKKQRQKAYEGVVVQRRHAVKNNGTRNVAALIM